MSQANTPSPEPGPSPGEPAVVVDAVDAAAQAEPAVVKPVEPKPAEAADVSEPGTEAAAGAAPNTVTVALGFAGEEFCGWNALEAQFKGRMRALEPESDPAPLLDICEAAIQRGVDPLFSGLSTSAFPSDSNNLTTSVIPSWAAT